MTMQEFIKAMQYLEATTGKPIDPDPKKAAARLEVFYDLLGDLDFEIFKAACQRVALQHPWSTFPSIAELREAAVCMRDGAIAELSAGEAWDKAWEAAKKIDLEIPGSLEHHTKNLPAIVLEAMRAFSIPALIYGKEPLGVIRSQFVKIYEPLATREKRRRLYPPKLIEEIKRHGVVNKIAGQIGDMR